MADEGRLGQVVLNLLVNAAQAIPPGNVTGNEVRIETGADAQGRAFIVVADSGCGMSPQVQARVFTPFFTTKPAGIGTGLGLAICQRIIRSLGGELSFRSQVGVGTSFRVTLPDARFDTDLPPAPETPMPTPPPKPRLLVVDDEEMIRRLVCRVFRQACEVVEADSAVHAVELIEAGERFDAVLCDLSMPLLSGAEFYAAARRVPGFDTSRIIFMTANAFDPANRAFLDSVSNNRIEKPFDVQGLRVLVASLVDRPTLSVADEGVPADATNEGGLAGTESGSVR
jgi:CheY-like chemotaxis protein